MQALGTGFCSGTASVSGSKFSNWKSLTSIWDTVKFVVLVSCAATLGRTSTRNSCHPCWLGLIEKQAELLSGTSCLWHRRTFQVAQRLSLSFKTNFRIGFSTIIVSKSITRSRVHYMGIEKIMLLNCKKKMFEIRRKMTKYLTWSVNEELTRLCHIWSRLIFHGESSDVAGCHPLRLFCSKEDSVSAPSHNSSFCLSTN